MLSAKQSALAKFSSYLFFNNAAVIHNAVSSNVDLTQHTQKMESHQTTIFNYLREQMSTLKQFTQSNLQSHH
jgi:hypothetical protein